MGLEHRHVKALEDLHLIILNARLRKRKQAQITPADYERFEQAIKATLPPFDFASHGFAGDGPSGEVRK